MTSAGPLTPHSGGDHERQPPDVRLVEVVKRFDETVAVDGISVEIPRGSFFALLGPSGCGKTTTLRMINRLTEPSAGTICAVSWPPARKTMCFPSGAQVGRSLSHGLFKDC
jgi:ABC-type Na+ transport system ATPase subunit NatA